MCFFSNYHEVKRLRGIKVDKDHWLRFYKNFIFETRSGDVKLHSPVYSTFILKPGWNRPFPPDPPYDYPVPFLKRSVTIPKSICERSLFAYRNRPLYMKVIPVYCMPSDILAANSFFVCMKKFFIYKEDYDKKVKDFKKGQNQ